MGRIWVNEIKKKTLALSVSLPKLIKKAVCVVSQAQARTVIYLLV